MFSQITTHAADMQARLTSQFQGLPNLAAIVAAHGAQYQDLEDAVFTVYNGWALPDCVGDALSRVGQAVKLPRPAGMSDPDYLPLVQAQIMVNTSDGSIETLLAVLRVLGATTARATVPNPATLNLAFGGAALAADSSITGALLAASAPVTLQLQIMPATNAFQFDSGPGFDVGGLSRTLL